MSELLARLTTVLADRYRIEREFSAGRMAPVSLGLLVLCTGTPMHLLAQCPDGSPPPCTRAAPRPAIQPTSLAVLYVENASRDTTDAYLADGLTEEIISRLSEVGRLQVKSRYQVRRYRTDATENAADIGRQLAVARIVTGSVRRAGNRVRVTAEMVRTATVSAAVRYR